MASLRSLLLAGLAVSAVATHALPVTVLAQTQVASIGGTATRIIGEPEIGKRIADLVQQRNGGVPVEIMFHGSGNELEIPATSAGTLKIDTFTFDNRSGRFFAVVGVSGGDLIKVSGRAQAVEAIPVLKNRINAGQVIDRNDIEWLRVPTGRYGAGYVDRIDDLIGQASRRALAAGAPIRSSDVGKPEAVTKNGLVTMVAQGPGMTITTTGRAMEAGSIGDVISVMNVQSKKTVQATIVAANQVQVVTAPRIIASN